MSKGYMKKTVGMLLFERLHRKSNTGSSRLRGHWMIKYWPEAEHYLYGKNYDAIVFQKAYLPDFCREFKNIKILDMCDPDWLEFVPLKETIDVIDGITVSSPNLKKFLKNMTDKPIKLIPDRHDMQFMKQKKIHKGKAKKIVWYGYSHNAYMLQDCVKAMIELDLELTIISDRRFLLEDLGYKEMKSRDKWIKWNLNTVNEDIIKSDIVLLPPPMKMEHAYKSDNKETGAWALGMPVAKTRLQLEQLLEEEPRIKEAEEKYKLAHEKYDIRTSVKEMQEFINDIRI
jgi:hypothetical protein